MEKDPRFRTRNIRKQELIKAALVAFRLLLVEDSDIELVTKIIQDLCNLSWERSVIKTRIDANI